MLHEHNWDILRLNFQLPSLDDDLRRDIQKICYSAYFFLTSSKRAKEKLMKEQTNKTLQLQTVSVQRDDLSRYSSDGIFYGNVSSVKSDLMEFFLSPLLRLCNRSPLTSVQHVDCGFFFRFMCDVEMRTAPFYSEISCKKNSFSLKPDLI